MTSLEHTETIDIIDSDRTDSEDVVDLTSEVTETSVVDLTNNDSVVLVDEGPHNHSDTDDSPCALRPRVLSSPHRNTSTRSKPGVVSCPICFDTYPEILHSGRVMVSTLCGHTFCSQCLRDSLAHAHTCPTCRKKLTHRQYHPIYI
ncbi:RING finger protein 4 [Alosa alosa]|uniref:RING finger protein 4 n=1 Tax=Alosa sapidissima TaxID=34773 RepID=UPI001C082505|nr:RING finger protein 4 [Alosa sapidissima]XP_048088170.1 RING finger protein 4 [Alosa alosa]